MGIDNYVKWHRQHCPDYFGHMKTSCAVCKAIAHLDNQLDGLDTPAYFEDHHYDVCILKNCAYCDQFYATAEKANELNQQLKRDGHQYSHVADQPDGWRVEACQNIECKAVIKKRTYEGRLTKTVMEPVPWWS